MCWPTACAVKVCRQQPPHPAAVARFFSHFKPRLGLLMETEILPNTVSQAQARAMPLLLVNGRLSEKSLNKALRVAALARPAYAALRNAQGRFIGALYLQPFRADAEASYAH